MPLVKVGSVSDLPPDSVMEASVGENVYAICHTAGRITAVSGVCLHRGGPLGQGAIHGSNVVCPWHMWEFDCRTGVYDYDPSKKIPVYDVKIDGDDILLQVS